MAISSNNDMFIIRTVNLGIIGLANFVWTKTQQVTIDRWASVKDST